MKPILLTAAQAAELHTTGRLTGYREKCDYDVPVPIEDVRIFRHDHPIHGLHFTLSWSEYQGHNDGWEHVTDHVTPPRDTDTTYAVKEPAMVDWVKTSNQDDSTEGADWIGAFVVYGEPPKDYRQHGEWHDCPAEYADQWNRDVEEGNHEELIVYTAEEMPDWAERMKAKIDNIQLVIEDGSLLWVYEVRKVG